MIATGSAFMALDRITAAGGFAPAGRRVGRDGKRELPSLQTTVQQVRGSLKLTPGQMSGVFGAGVTTVPVAGGVTTTAAGGTTITSAPDLPCGKRGLA
jgi:hypothetical protein